MATTLNHLKKGESLENKQLVIVNSKERDRSEQGTTSFTYTFDQPIERISKMEVMYTKIPKSFYNVNNDNATMSITTETFTETTTDNLVVDDTELQDGNILATNIIDGTVVKSNQLTGTGDILISKIITQDSFLYVSGKFCNDLIDFKNFTGMTANKPLPNVGQCDLFIAKYSLEQELDRRWRIGGNVDEHGLNIHVVSDFLFTAGNFSSFPLRFYNQNDAIEHSIVSDGNPTGFLAKYALDGEFEWAVKIVGVNRAISPIVVTADDTNKKVYVTGSYNLQLEFFNINNSVLPANIVTIPYLGTGKTNVFIAQYDYDGVLQWVSTMQDGCVAQSIVINPITLQPMVGIEYFDNLSFSTEYSTPGPPSISPSGTPLELNGVQNTAIVEFTITGTVFDRILIGGSSFESGIQMDVNDNVLAVVGLYNSNPLGFYDTTDTISGFLNINGLVNNIFITKYDLTVGKTYLWSTNIYDETDAIDAVDISIANTGEVLIVGNYTSLLKFNDVVGQQIGQDLINDTLNGYTFMAKYDSDGNFQQRSYIQTTGTPGSSSGVSIDAHSNDTFIVGQFSTTSIELYNSDNSLHTTMVYPDANPESLHNGYIISYVNNVNNYIIDITTLDRRIICRTLTGTDLNYILNLNAFTQQLGVTESTLMQAMIFGSPIAWKSLDINATNNVLSIEFSIGDKITKVFNKFVFTFTITTFVNYRPYNLAFELNNIIRSKLTKQSRFAFTQTDDVVKYDASKNIFYFIFTIDGTFKVLAPIGQPLYGPSGLNLPLTKSPHCVIADTNLVDELPITITDNSKLTIKIAENIVENRFNNVDFSVAFPNISSGSGVLNINGQLNNQMELVAGSSSDNLGSDLQVKDTMEFDAPWLFGDRNQATFESPLQWRSIASNFDNTILTACVSDGHIYISTSSGKSWSQREFTRDWRSVAMSRSGQYQTAVANNGQIYISSTSGTQWVPKESVRQWRDVAVSRAAGVTDGQHQTAVNRDGRIYVSHDYGETWIARCERKEWLSVAIDSTGVFQAAVIFGGGVWFSADSGITWDESPSTVRDWQSIAMTDDGNLTAAVTILDNVYYSTDKGATWDTGNIVSEGKILTEISFAQGDSNFQTIVGDAGSLYHTSDGGTTWLSNRTQESWSSSTLSDYGTTQTAIVRGGGIYQSVNNGLDWVEIKDSTTWLAVAMSSDGSLQMTSQSEGSISPPTGVIGSVWQSSDSGVTWSKDNIPLQVNHTFRQGGLTMSADGIYRYYTYSNGVVRSDDSGDTWNIIPLNVDALGVTVSVDGRHVTVGFRTGMMKVSNDFGLSFVSKGPSAGNRVVSMSADGSMQMSVGFLPGGSGGTIYTSQDYWNTWTQHVTSIDSWRTGTVSLDGTVLIAVGFGTSVYMSIDRGVTWQVNTQFAGNEIVNDFALSQDGSVILALRSNKPLYVSTDKGVTFQEKEIVREYQSASMSLTGEIQTVVVNGGGIFMSNDFGSTWNIKRRVFSEVHAPHQWKATAISRNGKYIIAGDEAGLMHISNNYGKAFIPIAGSNQLWTSAAVSDDGQKIVGLYTLGATFRSGVQTSWDGGTTFYTTDPSDSYGAISQVLATEIAMSADGSVAIFVGLQYGINDRNIYISTNSLPPTGAYDVSWVPDPSRDVLTFLKYPTCAMNAAGTIRYAGAGATDFGPTTPGRLMKWVSSNASEIHPGGPFDVWYDSGFVGDVLQVTCSDIGDKVVVGVTGQQLKVSTDFGNMFSGFVGPTIASYNDFPKVKMSGDGLVHAVVTTTNLYVSYDDWNTFHQHRVSRDRRSLSISEDGQRMITGEFFGWLYQSFDKGETFGVQQTRHQPVQVTMDALGKRQIIASVGRELYTSNSFGNIWEADGPAAAWSDIATSRNSESSIAVTSFGLMYVNDNVGSGWIVGGPTSQTTSRRWAACAVSGDGSYRLAAEENGLLYISNGLSITSTWTDSGAGTRNWSSCTINGDGSVMAATDFGGFIYVSVDNGANWSQMDAVRNWVSIAVNAVDTFIAAEFGGLLYHSSGTSGNTWTAVSGEPRKWQDVAVAGGVENYAAVALGDFIYTADISLIFEPRESSKNWVSVDMNDSATIHSAVEFNGEVYTSVDGGMTWSIQIGIKELVSVSMNYNGVIQAVAETGGQLYVSTDSGTTWAAKENVRAWRAIDVDVWGGSIVAVAYDDTVYLSTDSGVTWAPELLPQPKNNFVDVSISFGGSVILAAVEGGCLVRKLNDSWVNVGPTEFDWTGVAISAYGEIQYACAKGDGVGQKPIYKSKDYGTTWMATTSPSLVWSGIDTSGDGSFVTAITTGDQIYTSIDAGVTWIARDEARSWNGVSISYSGTAQVAIVNNGQIYASVDSGVTWVAKETNRQWRCISINDLGTTQLACDINRVLFHQFPLDRRISFTIDAIDSDVSLIDTAFTVETTTAELAILHDYDLSQGLNFTLTRTTEIPAQDIFVPPGNYTPETLVAKVNELITAVDGTWVNPQYGFIYDPVTRKVSFISKISGSDILVPTDLLTQMGFTDIPSTISAGASNNANNSVNSDLSGPVNIFIKSDIIGDLRKNKTVFSTNKNLENVIAPLKLNEQTNSYEVPFPIEIFLSKKETVEAIDIQIVDESGNIVNLNGGNVQVNFYFYSS